MCFDNICSHSYLFPDLLPTNYQSNFVIFFNPSRPISIPQISLNKYSSTGEQLTYGVGGVPLCRICLSLSQQLRVTYRLTVIVGILSPFLF